MNHIPWSIVTYTSIATWLFNMVITALISNLPAPTKDSSVKYVYWFKVANTIMGNLKRAQASNVENSPNWKDALDKKINGQVSPQVKSDIINSPDK